MQDPVVGLPYVKTFVNTGDSIDSRGDVISRRFASCRVRSLADIMNMFYVTGFAYVMHEISRARLAFIMIEQTGHGMDKPSGKPAEIMGIVLSKLGNIIPSDMKDCARAWKAAQGQWDDPLLNVSRAAQIASRLEDDLVAGTLNRQFLWIASDRENLADEDKLFGDEVFDKFPSAIRDIKEAGNCLAAECSTACVFHLMRASEIGLRSLAKDRDMKFPDKPLELSEWGAILPKLDSIVSDMRKDNAANWTDPQIKEAQVRYYNELSQELRTFNEVWRRHISHAREDGFYERDYAKSVMSHVEKMMQKLATKITENEITPKYWTAKEAKL